MYTYIYSDGSYMNNRYTYSYIIIRDGLILQMDSGLCPESFRQSNSIGAEVCAIIMGMNWLQKECIHDVIIKYDAECIWNVANGGRAYVPIMVRYKEFICKVNTLGFNLIFSHRDNKSDQWAKEVDRAAKGKLNGKHPKMPEPINII